MVGVDPNESLIIGPYVEKNDRIVASTSGAFFLGSMNFVTKVMDVGPGGRGGCL